MGEQGIPLENGIHLPLVGRHIGDVIALEQNGARIGAFKAADDAQGSRFAAARRAQQSDELFIFHIQVQVLKNRLFPVLLVNVLQLDQTLSQSTHLPKKSKNGKTEFLRKNST